MYNSLKASQDASFSTWWAAGDWYLATTCTNNKCVNNSEDKYRLYDCSSDIITCVLGEGDSSNYTYKSSSKYF